MRGFLRYVLHKRRISDCTITTIKKTTKLINAPKLKFTYVYTNYRYFYHPIITVRIGVTSTIGIEKHYFEGVILI